MRSFVKAASLLVSASLLGRGHCSCGDNRLGCPTRAKPGGKSARASRSQPQRLKACSRQANVEAVDFLGAAIAHQERGVVGSQADPEFPRIESAGNVFEVE